MRGRATDHARRMLISTTQLSASLHQPDWVVFDCRHDLADHARGERLYREGHIPGAFFAPVETALSGAKTGLNGRHPLPSVEDLSAFFAAHGVDETTQIVAYDDVGGQYAARLWWLARWIGLTRVAVLDGGLPKWLADGNSVETAIPQSRPQTSFVPQPDNSRFRRVDEVVSGIESATCQVIDARAPERFRGEVEPIDKVAGHIPSAVNRFFKLNLNADLTMRAPEELRREFSALLGTRSPETVVHQCGSGITACVNLLAMERAGLPGSKLFVGSWSEWSADPARPVARGTE